LDRLNVDQNDIRTRKHELESHRAEVDMVLANLTEELEKQRILEAAQKKHLKQVLRVAYQIKKDGVLRFMVQGKDLGQVSARARIVLRTLKSHALLMREVKARSFRLKEGEKKLAHLRDQSKTLVLELESQDSLLDELLIRKKEILRGIEKKQVAFQSAQSQYDRISKDLKNLFDSFDAETTEDGSLGKTEHFIFPLETGKIVKNFGKQVHPLFKTVVYHKGLEIEAPHQASVRAIADGIVEFEGWIRGLGNVLVLRHADGIFSLNAYLFKSLFKVGEAVKQGTAIALVGDTGQSDKPSLYFEIRKKGKAVDPKAFFPKDALHAL
jgi:septal ring factor EnvC (AmiA/AmiB activator)